MNEAAKEWVIEPRVPSLSSRGEEIWRYRYLLRFFAGQTLSKGYKRTVLGRAWLFIRPVVSVGINTIIFGGLLGVKSEGTPYLLFFLAGTSIWQLFSQCLMWSTRSLELGRRILRRLYFPHLILPVASLAPAVLNFGINLVFIVLSVAYFAVVKHHVYLNLRGFLAALAAVVMCLLLAVAIGLWTSVWAATARDIRFSMSYVLDLWSVLTPIIYPVSMVPEKWRWLLILNPMVAIVEAFKWGTIGAGTLHLASLVAAAAIIAAILVAGLFHFNRVEAEQVDRL
ncbi:MAG TPA: ABC transporter permease [Vicinamibacteria bacterium]